MKKSNSKRQLQQQKRRRQKPNQSSQRDQPEKEESETERDEGNAEDSKVVTAEIVWTEQEFQQRQVERQRSKRQLFRRSEGSRDLGVELVENQGLPYPRKRLGNIVRWIKIILSLLNVIVIRGSVLTRRKLNGKLEAYEKLPIAEEQMIGLYNEQISHHLFIFYLSWGRLVTCLTVLMWGTCDDRPPQPWALYLGMLMHWVDSIRALDSNNWLPSSDQEDRIDKSQRESTAEEEVQTAMAWLHLFWFIVDGLYCRQVLHEKKKREQQKQRQKRDLKND